jgi:hypothetical protein
VRLKRLIWFLIAIAAGAALGLLYGWVVNPVKYINTPLYSLKADYKADYVLMVAEIYHQDNDLNAAVERLQKLETDPPVRVVQRAVITAQDLGYTQNDIELLGRLLQMLQTVTPQPTVGGTP